MKLELTCGVVRDLLPSYVEGLTCHETNEAVEAHLAACPACAALRADLTAPAREQAEQTREVDYLKRVKRRNKKRVLLAMLLTVAVLLSAAALKLFVIGTPAQAHELSVIASHVENGVLTLTVSSPFSGTAYHGWTVEDRDGVARIFARSVTASPLFSHGSGTVEVPLEGISEVQLCGRVVWQEGISISEKALALLEAKTPYAGDAAALGAIASLLDIQDRLGSFSNRLHTTQRPYLWELELQEIPSQDAMADCAYQMLALVENLDGVRFTCGASSTDVSADQATQALAELTEAHNAACGDSWAVKASIKDYAARPADFQRLLTLLQGS